MNKVVQLPQRSKVKTADTWDLSSLYENDAAWEAAFKAWEQQIPKFEKFRGSLGESAEKLAECLRFDSEFDRLGERVGTYAFLKTCEDQADSTYQAMQARFTSVATRAAAAQSFIRPEILAIKGSKLREFLKAEPLEPFQIALERLIRSKKHTLGRKEENLLAMQGEMAQTATKAFRQLLDADMKFGTVRDDEGRQVELTNANFLELLQSPERRVRKAAFHKYYQQFAGHENTTAATLAGSIHTDVYYARVRKHTSSLAAALFPDNVPESVYDNLIASVRDKLPVLHRYYDVRRRKMKLRDIHHYDTYVPILSDLEKRHTWRQAVDLVVKSLEPLGSEYCGILEQGLNGRWSDRYPNKGKSSGAFSCGTFDGDPYILMNYKPDVLNDVFTLTHEAGHSMHSYYSSHTQPYEYYNYTIFVAEVASTFNECLLSEHLKKRADDDRERAYLVNREIDDMRGTIFRQTMFAEFEKVTHEMAEAGEPLTVQSFKDAYHKLLTAYFGPEFSIDDDLQLECFRIPHFYRAFYVYKYATGMSAAIALSERVLKGGGGELADYLSCLKGGCSKWPLELLDGAGVDMRTREPVDTALTHFESLVEELDELL